MDKKIKIEYINQKLETLGISFDVVLAGILCGRVFIPNNKNKKIVLTIYQGIQSFYVNKIATDVYKKYDKNIIVQTPRKRFEFTAPEADNNDDSQPWTRYYNPANKYIGKYREVKSGKQIGVDFVLKKTINQDDAFIAIKMLLKKYTVAETTISQRDIAPVSFTKSMPDDDIWSILVGIFPKKNIDVLDPRAETTVEKFDTPEHPDVANDGIPSIDPMILAKMLTVIMNKKQTVDAATQRAQQLANKQYVVVKLLDADGKFVCTIYPQDVQKIRAERMAQQERMMHRQY